MAKALVAGDLPEDAEMIAASLRRKEYATVMLCELSSVVSTARAEQPDLIIIDATTYSDASHAEVQLAFDPTTRQIPVVRITRKWWDGLEDDRERFSNPAIFSSLLPFGAAIIWIAVHWAARW